MNLDRGIYSFLSAVVINVQSAEHYEYGNSQGGPVD